MMSTQSRRQPIPFIHFDRTNILAHIRFNERTDADGRKVFLEEIQSDWAQKGRKEGFVLTTAIQKEARTPMKKR